MVPTPDTCRYKFFQKTASDKIPWNAFYATSQLVCFLPDQGQPLEKGKQEMQKASSKKKETTD